MTTFFRITRGATQLGPARATDAGPVAIVRDPGGALLALAMPPADPAPTGVVWHHLNTPDLPHAVASYGEICNWQIEAAAGGYEFAWSPGGPPVGSMADIRERPTIHPHWLFHFSVDSLDAALAAVRAAGGLALPPIVLSERRPRRRLR